MKKMRNSTHIEGLLYQHKLEVRVSGPQSKTPGTEFISGTIDIATDDNLTNIVQVHFSYEPQVSSKGNPNARYADLKKIIDGTYKTVMDCGADAATKLRIDSAIALNEFYDRNDPDTLVSVKRNEGGFIHVAPSLNPDEKTRNTFDVDIIITNVRHIEADDEKNLPEKAIIKGCIFNFRNELLPVEFSVVNTNAINYFESLEATDKNPVFTQIKGRQISETIVRKIVEESAFGEDYVREVTSSRKDYVVTFAKSEPYAFDDEETITAAELAKAIADRETALAALKARTDEYRASQGNITPAAQAAPVSAGGFNF